MWDYHPLKKPPLIQEFIFVLETSNRITSGCLLRRYWESGPLPRNIHLLSLQLHAVFLHGVPSPGVFGTPAKKDKKVRGNLRSLALEYSNNVTVATIGQGRPTEQV